MLNTFKSKVLALSKNKRLLLAGCFCLLLIITPITVLADDGLTDIFTTKAFQGSWEVINKFNWLGWLMNFIISAFSLIGLFLVLYSRLISLLYLSSRNLWDNVYEVKEGVKGEWFGFKGMASRMFKGDDGTGADAFVSFFYGLLPNVKKYSDYGNPRDNLSEDDNALNYMLKTLPQTVLLILFLALGFSGTLGQIYGTLVDGMVAVADNVVTIQLEDYVDAFFASGNHYRFTIANDGTPQASLQQVVAKRAYQEVVGKANILDGDARHEVGKAIEQAIRDTITADNDAIKAVLGKTPETAEDWKALDARVVLSPVQSESETTVSLPIENVFSESTYINIGFSGQKTYGDYFNRPE